MVVIIRVDDIENKFDLMELVSWFKSYHPDVPICVYLQNTHRPDKWDPEAWGIVKEMIEIYNWEVGGHSRTHQNLTLINMIDLRWEIIGNIKDIELSLGKLGLNYNVKSFAYPFGYCNHNIKSILRENNILYGLTYSGKAPYKPISSLPQKRNYSIGISCNDSESISLWNKQFDYAYKNNQVYILVLHTSHWYRGDVKKNIVKTIRSKSLRTFLGNSINTISSIVSKNISINWEYLNNHINYLKKRNVVFNTFLNNPYKGF